MAHVKHVRARLLPSLESRRVLAGQVAVGMALERSGRQMRCGSDVNQWMYAPRMLRWLEMDPLPAMLQHEFCRTYLAASAPFFADNITSFCPQIPLLVLGRAGSQQFLDEILNASSPCFVNRLSYNRIGGGSSRAFPPGPLVSDD